VKVLLLLWLLLLLLLLPADGISAVSVSLDVLKHAPL
jgi:hypothetical protein